MSRSGADIYSDRGFGSVFFHPCRRDTVLSVGPFVSSADPHRVRGIGDVRLELDPPHLGFLTLSGVLLVQQLA